MEYPLGATSSTRTATTSQPRSLLSYARLKRARSRFLPSIWSFVLIDHTWLGLSGGFAPTSFPLFHGTRTGFTIEEACSCSMVSLLARDSRPCADAGLVGWCDDRDR